jgi:RecJ-like exonuclease
MTQTITITTIVPRQQGIACPHCHGTGNLGDGSSSYSMRVLPNGDHEITTSHRDATPCPTCGGKGRVGIVRLDSDQ